MGDINRCIGGSTRIVTACACRPIVVLSSANKYVSGTTGRIHVIDIAVSSRFVGVAIQAVGRVGAGRDGGDDFSPGAAMTGRAAA